ncbi:alcohol dehydrogenase catalytic domain-containing protein [Leucobacter weissii]|uniref:Alcohol dehydrogenase catalytic domain-containing protein n=1 Tax=Leucobacter weissii TaxID=1983706 RepID=A0A939MK54_9MICO|nr:alcohol dehydrogenase catalytic domain-containing protein [Leucobacter weissii]MBO1901455.1 alcohol dehydrogenase catalytic domain-containing protein [Leucobacter weissii]
MFRGWQFIEPRAPLKLVEKEDPVPGEREVVVETRAAGLCHSDVGFMEGINASMLAFTPIIFGHEVSGTIKQLGPGVMGWEVGERVAIAGLGLDAPGLNTDGGFGEKVLAKEDLLVRIPEGVSFVQGAAATDAGQTSRKALRVGDVGAGTRVGIIGLGGLGLTAAKMAVMLGAEVHAVEINEGVWPLAVRAGVKRVVASPAELADEQLDVFVDYAGFGTTTAAAIDAVRNEGTVVQVGMGAQFATIDTTLLVAKQVRLLGSLGGSYEDTLDVLRLMKLGLEITATEIGFDEIPAGLERLKRGEVRGRLVATRGE